MTMVKSTWTKYTHKSNVETWHLTKFHIKATNIHNFKGIPNVNIFITCTIKIGSEICLVEGAESKTIAQICKFSHLFPEPISKH
jgi:hypothetical protein